MEMGWWRVVMDIPTTEYTGWYTQMIVQWLFDAA